MKKSRTTKNPGALKNPQIFPKDQGLDQRGHEMRLPGEMRHGLGTADLPVIALPLVVREDLALVVIGLPLVAKEDQALVVIILPLVAREDLALVVILLKNHALIAQNSIDPGLIRLNRVIGKLGFEDVKPEMMDHSFLGDSNAMSHKVQ